MNAQADAAICTLACKRSELEFRVNAQLFQLRRSNPCGRCSANAGAAPQPPNNCFCRARVAAWHSHDVSRNASMSRISICPRL